MKIKINTQIDSKLENDEIEITIKAPQNSEMLNKIIENIQATCENIDTIVGTRQNNVSIINTQDVICFLVKLKIIIVKPQMEILKLKRNYMN